MHPDTAEKVELFLTKLKMLLEVNEPYEIVSSRIICIIYYIIIFYLIK